MSLETPFTSYQLTLQQLPVGTSATKKVFGCLLLVYVFSLQLSMKVTSKTALPDLCLLGNRRNTHDWHCMAMGKGPLLLLLKYHISLKN